MFTKNLRSILIFPSMVLFIPVTAMLLKVDGWAWQAGDFVVAWMLMVGIGLAWKLITTKTGNRSYRCATGIALAAGLLLVWVNGAVGLIGSEDNPANLMYAGVLLAGMIGAAIARLEPRGMALASFATAIIQFLIPVIALLVWPTDFSPGIVPVFGLNLFFVLLFTVSGLLFQYSTRNHH